MNIQNPLSFREATYKEALSKIQNSNNKHVVFDENLNVHYAGFFRRLLGKVKALLGQTDQTQREVVVYRAIQFLELGAHEGWLEAKKTLQIASQFITNSDGTQNEEVVELIDKIYHTHLPWKNLPQKEDLQFSQRYAEHYAKKLKKIVTRPLFFLIPEIKQSPAQSIVPQLLLPSTEDIAPINPPIKDKDIKQIAVPKNAEDNLPTAPKVPLHIQELERLEPIEQAKKEGLEPIPLFIYDNEESIKGVCDSLKLKFPKALFISKKELEKFLEDNQNTPVVAYYLQRFDESVVKPDEQLFNHLSKYDHIRLAFVGLSREHDKNVLEEGIKKFNQHLKNSPIPSVQQTKCLTMTFETAIVNGNFYPKLTKSEENSFFKKIQQVLDEAQFTKKSFEDHQVAIKNERDFSKIKNSPIHGVTPIQQQPTSSSLLPVFIYRSEGDIKSIYGLLKNKYSQGIFTTMDQFLSVLDQNKNKPLVIFFIETFTNRVDDIPSLISPVKPMINYDNANLVYVGLIHSGDKVVLKDGLKKLENLFRESNSPNLKEANCIAIGYEMKYSYEGGEGKHIEKLSSQEEENFLKQINQFLKKDQK